MRFLRPAAGFALAAVLATSAAAQTSPASSALQQAQFAEGVVATVNDRLISSYDLRQRMLLIIATTGVQPTEQNLPQIQQQAFRALVDEHLKREELRRYDLKVTDEEVDQQIRAFAADSQMSPQDLVAGLESVGITRDTFREYVRTDLGWRYLVQGRYGPRTRIGADQVDQTLQRIAAAAAKPQYLLGEIYIDAQAVGGMENALFGAEQLVQQILQGAPFQAVARQFSNAPSAVNGGDAGWMISGELPGEVQTVVEQMQAGQLSRPIRTDNGVYIILVRERRAGAQSSTAVNLKQAAVAVNQTATPEQLQAAQTLLASVQTGLTCDNIEDRASAVPGVIAGELGEIDVEELSPDFRAVVDRLQVGQVGGPVRTPVGLHLLAVCGKRAVGANLPTRDQIEDRLFGQQLAMLERRYIRDLRNSATIETK